MNRRLLLLNGLAILAVVFNHASHNGFIAMFWWTDRYRPVSVPNFDQMGSLQYYGLIAAQKLALFSVPSFLIVTGMFIIYAVRGNSKRYDWEIVKKRVMNLLPPYFLWSFVYILSKYILGDKPSLPDIILGLLGVLDPPFFYVPLLIICYILSPILVPIARKNWKVLLIGSMLIHIAAIVRSYLQTFGPILGINKAVYPLQGILLPSDTFYEYQFYFVLGIILSVLLPSIKKQLRKIKWLLFTLVIVFAGVAIAEAEWVFRLTENAVWRSTTLSLPTALYILSFILCFLAFEDFKIPFSVTLHQIGSSSLGIYLIHRTVLLFLPKIIYHIAPWMLAYQVIYQPVLVAFAVGIPMLMMASLRVSPLQKAYRQLYG